MKGTQLEVSVNIILWYAYTAVTIILDTRTEN